ncbi:MAG TPA: alpha/beta hydrolase, partial [Dehalococcoidia bacterium]
FRSRGGGTPTPIRTPTLVLWAENDPILPVAWADNLAQFFPDHRLVRVPECGHFVQRERPDVVNREVAAFLDAP